MLYSTLFDSSRHIYLSLQFTHVRLYPSSLFKMLFLLPEKWQFSSLSFYPNSTELPEASAQTYYYVFFFFFAPSLSVTPLPPLLLSPWAMHTLTGIPRCLTPCLREGTDIIPTCIPHCASSIVHWGIYVGITFPRKPCQRHLRNNSLSNFICQEGVMRSSFKTNRQVAFFYITLSS